MIGCVGARISDASMHRGSFGLDHLRDLHTRCGRLQRPPVTVLLDGWTLSFLPPISIFDLCLLIQG